MYNKTTQAIKANNTLTTPFRTYVGVRQGCILGPKLFNIFINDIPDIFNKECTPAKMGNIEINCLMYADDLIIVSETEKGLQNSLAKLKQYTKKWNLQVNMKKTKIMIFQNKGRRPRLTFRYGKEIIEETKTYKYLGSIVTNTGNFKNNNNNMKKKGLRASFLVTQNIGKFSKASTAINIFEKIVEPILLYNSEITQAYIPKWNIEKFIKNIWSHGSELNKVSLSFLRQILGVHKKTTNIALESETGKYPICLKIYSRIIKYWVRLHSTENEMLKEALKCNIQLNKDNKTSWTKIIEYLTQIMNINMTPNKDEKINNNIIKLFKQNIETNYKEWWSSQAIPTGHNKLDFYYKFKKTFKYEKYLDNVPRNLRMYITRLRTSSHNLPIETLRYKKDKKGQRIARENRSCNICNTEELGDEEHYIFTCKNHKMISARDKFISNVKGRLDQFTKMDNTNIIRYCLIMHDDNVQSQMAEFAKEILCSYKEESMEIENENIENSTTLTRSGREGKKKEKLNL